MTTDTINTQADQIAEAFARLLKEWLPAADYAAMVAHDKVNANSCANDYCDANQVLIEVFANVLGREPYFGSDFELGLATEAQVDADFDLLESAWTKARSIWTA